MKSIVLTLLAASLVEAQSPLRLTRHAGLPAGNRTAQATPVKYSGVMPPQSFPASYSMPAGTTVTAMPTGGLPMIPPPPVNATELPMPSEVIPPTILPTNPISGGRAVGLPK